MISGAALDGSGRAQHEYSAAASRGGRESIHGDKRRTLGPSGWTVLGCCLLAPHPPGKLEPRTGRPAPRHARASATSQHLPRLDRVVGKSQRQMLRAVNIFRRASINSDPAAPPPGARANVAGGQKAGSARSRGSEGPVLT